MPSPRKPADPQARLNLLRPVLAELKPGEIQNADDMAKTARMTWANLVKIIDSDADFPIVKRGGMGIPWEFDAHAVVAFLIRRAEETLAKRRQSAERMMRLTGIAAEIPAVHQSEQPLMTAAEIAQATNAAVAQHKLKEAQRQVMPAGRAVAFFTDLCSTFQAETLAFLGQHDPAGQLPPETRKAIDDYMRTLLVTVQGKLESFVGTYGQRAA